MKMARSSQSQNSAAFIIAMNVLQREMNPDGLMANDRSASNPFHCTRARANQNDLLP